MAATAKGDEIFFHIPSQQASQLNVMELEISGAAGPRRAWIWPDGVRRRQSNPAPARTVRPFLAQLPETTALSAPKAQPK